MPGDLEQNRERKASPRVASEAKPEELDNRREGGTLEFGGSARSVSSTIAELFEASRTGSVEEVECLLRRGCDPNGMFESGLTSLHIAAQKGHLSVVEVLVENGAHPNVRTVKRPDIPFLHFRDSVLHFAGEQGHAAVVEYLLRNGAEADARNSEGLTPLNVAVMNTIGLKPPRDVLTIVTLLLALGPTSI